MLAKTKDLDYHRLETVLIEVVAVLNKRPNNMKYTSLTDYLAIGPADFLLGRTHSSRTYYREVFHLRDNQRVIQACAFQQAVVRSWDNQWVCQALAEMTSRQSWNQRYRLVKAGYIGHIIYKINIGSQDCLRLCRVKEVFPDTHGIVCTYTVKVKPKYIMDTGKWYVSKIPETIRVGVQWFSVLLPVKPNTSG